MPIAVRSKCKVSFGADRGINTPLSPLFTVVHLSLQGGEKGRVHLFMCVVAGEET